MIALLLVIAQIVRPVDHAALAKGPIQVIAKGPAGARLELDGQAVRFETPFPGVITANVDTGPGRHRLVLIGESERHEIEIAVGAAAGFTPYRVHPPTAAACTQCHGVSARGRFRFQGGCFGCHATAGFAKPHTHDEHKLAECGLCHNAHGSIAKGHLVRSRESACQVCHE